MSGMIRILLADKQPLMRAGIRATMSAAEGLTLVGESGDGYEVLQLSRELKPTVLLLDPRIGAPMPMWSQILAYLHKHCPEVKVLVLATDDNFYMRDLTVDGMASCMLKDEGTETLLRAIRIVAQGDIWFSQRFMKKLEQQGRYDLGMNEKFCLTDREQQVLNMIAQGWDNAHIAAELHLALQTVRNYVSRIYSKLSVNSRAAAIICTRDKIIG